MIEQVYEVEEFAFDAKVLANYLKVDLEAAGVEVKLESEVFSVSRLTIAGNSTHLIETKSRTDGECASSARLVFNCCYSGMNQLKGDFTPTAASLKHELTEMALIQMPDPLVNVGITVMDGPFFSVMPFPARQLHTLSHVRYTPHLHWPDFKDLSPYARLDGYDRHTRFDRMIRDAARYVPALKSARYCDSLFEIKTVLVKNETDDGRPILLERQRDLPFCYSILGGKIDNIFDVLEKLDGENWTHPTERESAGAFNG